MEIFTLMISLCDLHNIRISELVLILGSDIWDSQLSSNTALRIVHFLKNSNWRVGLKRCLMSFLCNMPRSRGIYLKKVKFSMTESQSTARQILTLVLHCKIDVYSFTSFTQLNVSGSKTYVEYNRTYTMQIFYDNNQQQPFIILAKQLDNRCLTEF